MAFSESSESAIFCDAVADMLSHKELCHWSLQGGKNHHRYRFCPQDRETSLQWGSKASLLLL